MAIDALKRIREICLALPGASEKAAWGEVTFRVGGKMFAMTDGHNPQHGPELALWCNAPREFQEAMVKSNPARFYVPKYVGGKGWIAVRIDRAVDWHELGAIVAGAHRITAPAPRRKNVRAASPPKRRRTPASTLRS